MERARLPLSALLSQALVAFTIELDNCFEQRMPHRTTDFGGTRGAPWAVSLMQWSNFMQFVVDEGVTVRELTRRSRAGPALRGMQRWGYVTVRDGVVAPTAAGRRAQEVWRPLPDQIEQRWRERFGESAVAGLRAALEPLAAELGEGLPQWLTHYYGEFAQPPDGEYKPFDGELALSALLSQVLQAFALHYEQGTEVSLCFAANVVRVLDASGVPVTELPDRSGVAMPALSTALGILVKQGVVEVGSGRGRLARLTDRGVRVADASPLLMAAVEAQWCDRFGVEAIGALRELLEQIVPGLFAGLEPPAGTWRSKTPQLGRLPDFPMPRQGGHPDGV